MVFSVFSGGIEKKERKCLSVALCKKIWTLPLESGILGFGICITIEIRNPSSIEKESVIQYLESRIPNPRFWQARLPQFGGGWGECGLIFRIATCNRALGRFPPFRTDWPDHSRRNDNFSFNQNSPARSVKSWIVCTKGDHDFSAKTLGKSLIHY